MKKKISFHTLGCKVNFAETSTLAREFAEAGFERVGGSADFDGDDDGGGRIPLADVYVVNTCSVTAAADKKCRNLIARLHRRSPEAIIAVTGCYAQLAPEKLAAMDGVSLIFGNNYKNDITRLVAMHNSEGFNPRWKENSYNSLVPSQDASTTCGDSRRSVSEILPSALTDGCAQTLSPSSPGFSPTHCSHSDIERIFPAYSVGDRTRSFLKVQDGCDYRCSYCTIHYARGGSRNIPIAKAVEQAREIAACRVKEIVLTGVNTGDFGRTTGEKFIDLLRALDGVEGIERYRISSIEPNLLTDETIDFCASSPKFQDHFHIPLQSGSDRILGLMRRRYTTAKFADRLARVREVMPDTFFGVDVIVGFPGETEDDFEQTRAFLERVRPAQLHVFPYSVRPGTPAAEMPGRVSPKVAAERAAVLGALSEELHAEFTALYAGTSARVLWEAEQKDGMMSGFTGNYIRVSAPYDPQKVNTVTETTIPGQKF